MQLTGHGDENSTASARQENDTALSLAHRDKASMLSGRIASQHVDSDAHSSISTGQASWHRAKRKA